MYRFREDEQDYAIIPDVESPELNRYGKSVQLVEKGDNLAEKSLNINSDPSVGENPNRYKQHGFTSMPIIAFPVMPVSLPVAKRMIYQRILHFVR